MHVAMAVMQIHRGLQSVLIMSTKDPIVMANRKAAVALTYIATLLTAGIAPASASVYYVTYNGTASGTDTNGVFGAAGAVLTNVAFTSTYSYDPTLFGTAQVDNLSTNSEVYGGLAYGLTDPLSAAEITIGGRTYYQDSSFDGAQSLHLNQNNMYTYACSASSNCLINGGVTGSAPILSLTYLQSFSFNYQAYGADGAFQFNGEDLFLTDMTGTVTNVAPVGFSLPPPPTAVPEPGTYALLAGAAMSVIGLAGNRRRRAEGSHVRC